MNKAEMHVLVVWRSSL